MKTLMFIILVLITFRFGACSSPPGPAERAAQPSNNTEFNVGPGVVRPSQDIEQIGD